MLMKNIYLIHTKQYFKQTIYLHMIILQYHDYL